MRQVFITQINNLQNFNQMQKEAAVDLLLLVMYADGIVDPKELEYIDRLLIDSSWESETSMEDYFTAIKPKVLEALEDSYHLERFVEHSKLQIGDKQKLQSIYTLCATMANSDKNVDAKELDILKILMDSLS